MAAAAQLPEVVLTGIARAGTNSRPARFHFFCTSNAGADVTGALSVGLEVPNVEQMRSVFDVDPFEGPSARAGALSSLDATGAHGKARASFTAAGYYPPDPPGSFMFEVAAARRPPGNTRLKAVARVLRSLTDAPGKLLWRQGNAKPKGVPIVATVEIEKADARRLRSALGPCLAAP